jgi:hypothetical protein
MHKNIKFTSQITHAAQISRSDCVKMARSWLGTRYRHQGRRKKNDKDVGGVDCLGLLMGVAKELNLCDKLGEPLIQHNHNIYSKQPDANFMLYYLSAAMEQKPLDGLKLMPADVLLLEMDGNAQHLALCSDGDAWGEGEIGMIHAYAPARMVVEHRLDEQWKARIHACFQLIDE